MPLPFATEADVQGLLTMLFFSALTGGNPPLFMDFRKVWEQWELEALAQKVGVTLPERERGRRRAWSTATTPAARRSIGRRSPARASRRSWRVSACRWQTPTTSPAWATR